MKRKAYTEHFKDTDTSAQQASKIFLLNPTGRKENIEDTETNPIKITLRPNQGLKVFYYSATDGWTLKFFMGQNMNEKLGAKNTVTTNNIEIKAKYIMYYEFVTYSERVDLKTISEYSNQIFRIEKDEIGQNGNKGNIITQGMFNVSKAKDINVSGMIGNRNYLYLHGTVDPQNKKIRSSANVVCNNGNYIHINCTSCGDSAHVLAKNNNFIYTTKNINEHCIFNEDNIVMDCDLRFKSDLYLLSQYPKLAFRTKLSANGAKGDTFVAVEDTSFVLLGIKFMFSSVNAGFVIRNVTGAIDGKIYFNKPLSEDEAPIEGGICFAEVPKEKNKIVVNVTKKADKFSRRLYIDKITEDVYLRNISIYDGDKKVMDSIALYYDEPSSLLIINNILPQDLSPDNAKIVFNEYKFIGPFNFEIGSKIPNLYNGQSITCDTQTLIVEGFKQSKDGKADIIKFKDIEAKDMKGKEATTAQIPNSYYAGDVIPFTKLKVVGGKQYEKVIQIVNTKGLVAGAYIKYRNKILKILEVQSIKGSSNVSVSIEIPFVPFILNKCIIIDNIVLEQDFNIAEVEKIANDFQQLKEKK